MKYQVYYVETTVRMAIVEAGSGQDARNIVMRDEHGLRADEPIEHGQRIIVTVEEDEVPAPTPESLARGEEANDRRLAEILAENFIDPRRI